MALLVYNIEPASPSMISSLDRHCLARTPDGASNIVTARSHLNQILEGDKEGLMQSLRKLYESGVQKPAAQSEKPYLRIVVSASPEYFRPDDPDAIGTWDETRLAAWKEATMTQLREEHSADLIFAELHLDEDTPHIHAVVAPTYSKKARKPGKAKRGETPDQFEARKAAALASEGVRTVGRASHPTLSKQGSFQRLRERMTVAVDHLGIEYGEDRAIGTPDGQSTREWVIQQAADLRKLEDKLKQDREALERDRENSLSEALERQRIIDRTDKLAEARREVIRSEAATISQRAADNAQRASEELLKAARKEAGHIKREATPERFQVLEKENAQLRKQVEGWENFFRSVRQTLSTLLAGQWETVRQKLNEAWKSDPKNPEFEPKPTPPSYSSGPSGL